MSNKLSLKLFLSNAAVFMVVLCLFSAAVYFPVVHNLRKEQEQRLLILATSVIGSLEGSDVANSTDEIPEILEADNRDVLPGNAALQWFNASGHLVAAKGNLQIVDPLLTSAFLQQQKKPHLLLLTEPVIRRQQTLGFLRAAISLNEFDVFCSQLLSSLMWGTLLAMCAASLGAVWLVRQSLIPIEKTVEKLSQFTADAAHELRNPLMAVKTNASVALRHNVHMNEDERKKFLTILDATDQMIRTTTDLLALAQTEQKHEPDEPEIVELNSLIGTLINKIEHEVDCKNIEIKNDISGQILIQAGEEDLKTIFGNLLRNAVQYTSTQGIVTVRALSQGRRVKVLVIDTGLGISKHDLPKIFDRFWRSDKARSHRKGGNGLGLAIVKAAVERCGGDISISSVVNVGTSVEVLLPVLSGTAASATVLAKALSLRN